MTTEKRIALHEGDRAVHYTHKELEELHAKARESWVEIEKHWDEALARIDNPTNIKPQQCLMPSGISSHHVRYAKEGGSWTLGLTHYTVSKNNSDYTMKQLPIEVARGKDHKAKLLEKNDIFLKRALRGTLRPADALYWLSEKNGGWTLHAIRQDTKRTCELCDSKVNPTQFERHQLTLRCKELNRLKQIRERGYIFTNDQRLIGAVKRGIIVGEAIPVKYQIYAPKWAIEAAQMYDKQKGYANLEFDDYLTRMNSEQK